MTSYGRYVLANILTVVFYRIFSVRKKIIIKNLRYAFGSELSEKEIKSLSCRSFRENILTFLDFLGASNGELAKYVKIHNRECLEGIINNGNGGLVLCAHLGNWEALGAAINRYVHPVHIIVKKVGSESVNRFVVETRIRNRFIPIDRSSGMGSASRTIFRAIKKNELVGFVMDQSRPGEPKVDFFNHPAKTNTGLATIAIKTKAPVIPMYIKRTGMGRYDAFIEEPLQLPIVEDYSQSVLDYTLIFNKELEKMIRKCPEQYFWMHDRWKD